ncbi:FkbM family methyltransferase [Haladaptatus sp. NG-WS-4]
MIGNLTKVAHTIGSWMPKELTDAGIKAVNRICGPYYTENIQEYYATFYCPTTMSWELVNIHQVAEKPVVSRILEHVPEREGTIFYDIGANIGFFTCFVGQAVESTYSFEPYPPNVSLLEKNISINNVDATVIDVALSDNNSEIELNVPITDKAGAAQGTMLSSHPLRHDFVEHIKVKSYELDKYVVKESFPAPDIVKIDVEGAEINVLEGMKKILSEEKPTLFIEPHGTAENIKLLLREYNYTFCSVSSNRKEDEHPTIIAN